VPGSDPRATGWVVTDVDCAQQAEKQGPVPLVTEPADGPYEPGAGIRLHGGDRMVAKLKFESAVSAPQCARRWLAVLLLVSSAKPAKVAEPPADRHRRHGEDIRVPVD
jgi:hypothetical protein